MKRLLTVLMGFILLLGVSGTGTAEEVRYPMYEINFAIGVSGNTTQPSDISASGGSVFYLNGTSDSVLDMSLYKTARGKMSYQITALTPKQSITGSTNMGDLSSTTCQFGWQASNVNDTGVWDLSGITLVSGTSLVPMSGSTPIVRELSLDFAKYYRFKFFSGPTAYENAKFKLILQ